MKTKTRIASRAESMALEAYVRERHRADLSLPDGHEDAMRVLVDAATGQPMRSKYDDTVQVCAPWLLCGIFSVPAKSVRRSDIGDMARESMLDDHFSDEEE